MKQIISSDRPSNNVPGSRDLSLGKAGCISSHANKLCFSFDEAPDIFISIPLQRCNYSEPCLPSSLPETSNSSAKSVLPLASTSGGFGLSLLSHREFSRGFSWKVAPVQPQGHFCWKCVLCTTWKSLIFEESSPTQLPLRLLFSDEQKWSSDSLPHSEQFRTTYSFQSCSGLKLGAECIICTCPETIIDKHLPDTA